MYWTRRTQLVDSRKLKEAELCSSNAWEVTEQLKCRFEQMKYLNKKEEEMGGYSSSQTTTVVGEFSHENQTCVCSECGAIGGYMKVSIGKLHRNRSA